MSQDADESLVEKTARELGEHFDTVQIFCTRHDSGSEGGTIHVTKGVGNYFARYGQCREWLVKEEEETRVRARKESGDE